MDLGWEGCSPRSAFDILPIVIQFPGRPPHVFQIPKTFCLEVATPYTHHARSQYANVECVS
jgi:nitric oxide synthase oxygenase domain/subunit